MFATIITIMSKFRLIGIIFTKLKGLSGERPLAFECLVYYGSEIGLVELIFSDNCT